MFNLIQRFYVIHYAGSLLKFLWSFIIPVILTISIYMIFKKVFLIKEKDSLLIIASGYLFWQFISSSISRGHRQLLENRNFFKHLSINRKQFIPSFIIFNFLNNLPGILIVTLYCWLFCTFSFIQLIILICSIFLILMLLCGIVFLLATWTVFYPDISHGIDSMLLFLLWVSPIFYSSTSLPNNLQWMVFYNPIAWFIELIRYSLGLEFIINPLVAFLCLSIVSLSILIFGFFYHKKHIKELIQFL